jgi:hypothetical protein
MSKEEEILEWVYRGGLPENRGKYFIYFNPAEQANIIHTEKNISVLVEIFTKTSDKIRSKILLKVLNEENFVGDVRDMLKTAASFGFIYRRPDKMKKDKK